MKKLLVLSILICGISNFAYAASLGGYDAGAMNTQYVRDMRMHEAITREKNRSRSAIVSPAKPTTPEPRQQEQSIVASEIKSVVFINNYSIPSNQLLYAIQNDINKPMTPENISKIRKDVMRYYQNNGFFSAIAQVVSQDTQNGEIVIEVTEGGRNSIQIEN